MDESELNEFFAQVDEISQDCGSLDQFQLLQKYKSENNRLKKTLCTIRETTQGLLDILKEERRVKAQAQLQLDQAKGELLVLQNRYGDLERASVNSDFSYNEKTNEMEIKHQSLVKNHQELAKDYFEVLQEATQFYNFEVKKEHTRVINKTAIFLKEALGDKFKRPHLTTKKSVIETRSTVSKRTRGSKKEVKLVQEEIIKKSKRRRLDIFEMQSISEVSSPASFYDEGADDMGEDDSAFTYNTFSIGNETSFTVLQNNRVSTHSQTISQCKCYVDPEETELVSIGVNTEEFDVLPSVPTLVDDDFFFDEDHVVNSTVNCTTEDMIDLEPIGECMEKVAESSECVDANDNHIMPTLASPPRKEMKDQSTSCEPAVTKSDKSTLTTRSLTHRGTMTPALVTKNFGMQFPDLTFDKIIEEMEFEVPDCLSPIKDFEKVSRETQTDLQNVNRDLCSNEATKSSLNSEDQSFIILGQSIFNLFLDRLKESNKAVDDDARTREKLWQFLRHQYLDRFDELTFDEYFSTSLMTDSESLEDACLKSIENIPDIKEAKVSKENLIEESMEWQLDVSDSSSQKSSEVSNDLTADLLEDLAVSSSTSSDKESQQNQVVPPLSPIPEVPEAPESLELDDDIKEVEEILKSIENIGTEPIELISPILEFEDFMWSTIFPQDDDKAMYYEEESPQDDERVLEGFDVDHEPIEIPTEFLESPDEPPPTAISNYASYEPQIIPLQNIIRRNLDCEDNVIAYNRAVRFKLASWQQMHTISSKNNDKMLCKARKIIGIYLNSDWTDENLEACVSKLKDRREHILLEAIYETVEDNLWDKEINAEFTPPAPPLPRYQQKLILLISKLAQSNPKLPHRLVADLEMKLFKLDATSTQSLDHLRNVSYYYTALVDLFFDGNSTMAFYFIVKCMYFYGYKAIPMAFVVAKAFPLALPKKSSLIKKYNDAADWESLTGLEMSKIRLDLDWVDSLELCVMYLLTNIQMYRKKGNEFKVIYEHELFNYVPKYYGFALNFLSAQKLVEVLMKRIVAGELANMSFALILLAKRMTLDFTMKTLMRGHLMPMLSKCVTETIDSDVIEQSVVDKICLLIEVISSIIKPLNEEKERSFKEIFPMIINILGRTSNQQIQECCIKAILRLQRFIQNHKEIYEIIKHRYEKGESFSETLRHSISTFIHRKNEVYFKN